MVEQRRDLRLIGKRGGDLEIFAGGKGADQVAARRGLVHIEHGHADIGDVGVQGEGHDGHLDHRHAEDHHPHPRVAQHLQEFLDEHAEKSLQHGLLQFEGKFAVGATIMISA